MNSSSSQRHAYLRTAAIAIAALATLAIFEIARSSDGATTTAPPTYGPLKLLAGSSQVDLGVPVFVAVGRNGASIVVDGQRQRILNIAVSGRTTIIPVDASPRGVTLDQSGKVILSDIRSNRILRIEANEKVTAVAGDGSSGSIDGLAKQARFNAPLGLATEKDGSILIADSGNHRIRRITPEGLVTTVAGTGKAGHQDGPAIHATFNSPQSVSVTPLGDILVADTGNNAIRLISRDGAVRTLGVSADGKIFDMPRAAVGDSEGNVYVVDAHHNVIRKISADGQIGVLAGKLSQVDSFTPSRDGQGDSALIPWPVSMCWTHTNTLLVAQNGGELREVALDGTVTTVTPGEKTAPTESFGSKPHGLLGLGVDHYGRLFMPDAASSPEQFNEYHNHFSMTPEVALDSKGDLLVADGPALRRISPDGSSTILAGHEYLGRSFSSANTQKNEAQARSEFYFSSVAVGPDGKIYASDTSADRIVKVESDGSLTTVAGGGQRNFWGSAAGYQDGPTSFAMFDSPRGLAVAPDGAIYVADASNNAIRKIHWGWVSTVAGGRLTRKGEHGDGITESRGYVDGAAENSEFAFPIAVALDDLGNLIVADAGNTAVRRIDTRTKYVETLFGPRGASPITALPDIDAVGTPPIGVAVLPGGDIVIPTQHGILISHPANSRN